MNPDTRAIADLLANVSLGAPQNAIGFVLWRVVHRYQREVDRALAELDLSHLQFETLILAAWLSRSGVAPTQAELARFGDIQPMQVSHMLKTLQAKRLVSRTPSRTNVHAKCVSVTRSGLSTLRLALPLVIDVQRRMFGDEGRPGGSLLSALLQVDDRRSESAK